MSDLFEHPWLGWSLAVVVGLPVLTVVLAEVHLRLARRGSPMAKIVNRLRIWLLPSAALLVLLVAAAQVPRENNGVRLVATVVGLVAVSVALGVLNTLLFDNAAEGTWRQRLPSIFVDLGRLVLVVAGAALVASYVWGFDVGGLFAALGVGSIVIGLALQNAVGSVVSGLLLLFEQPFTLGDTLSAAGVTGRVVEVNWRSTHIDTGTGIQVIPNAVLAGSAFTNLSRPTPAHDLVLETTFGAADAPHRVTAVLQGVAANLTNLRPGASPTTRPLGAGKYATTLPLVTAADSGDTQSQFLLWLWYAARRAGLSHDGAAPPEADPEAVRAATASLTTALSLTEHEIDEVARRSRLVQFAPGEALLRQGFVPTGLAYLHEGFVVATVRTRSGTQVTVAELDRGEVVGSTVLLREPSPVTFVARSTVTALMIPADMVTEVVASRPLAGRRLAAVADMRQRQLREALDKAGEATRRTTAGVSR